jgi:hypothetical protein
MYLRSLQLKHFSFRSVLKALMYSFQPQENKHTMIVQITNYIINPCVQVNLLFVCGTNPFIA